MSEITRYKTGGAWKQVNNVYYKLSGTWKDVTYIRHKISGTTWKVVFNSTPVTGVPNISITTLTDDYPTGSAISGTYANYHGLYYYNDNVSMYDIFKAAGYAVGAWTSANEAPWGNLTFNVDTYMVGSNNTLPTIYCGDDNTHGSWFFPIGGSSNGINVASGRFYLEIGKDGNIATYNGGLKLAFVDEIGWTLPHVSGKPYNGTNDLLNTTDPQNLTEVWEKVDEYKWLYGTQNIDLIDPRYNDKRILTNLYVNASGSSSTVGYYSITLYEGSYYIKYETEPNGYSNTDVLGISNYTSGATLTGWTADSSTLPGGSTGTASVTVPVNTTFNGVQKGGRLYRETFEISVLHPTHIASGTYSPTGDTYAELVTKKTNTTLTINIKRGGWVMGAPGDRGQSATTGYQGPSDNSTDDNSYHSDNTYGDWIEDFPSGNNGYGSADMYWPQTRGGTVKFEYFVSTNDQYNRGRGYDSTYNTWYSPGDNNGFLPSAALSASIWGTDSFQHYTMWDSRATYYNGKDGKKGATAINANLTDIDIDVNVEAEGILFGGLGGVGEGGHGPAIQEPAAWTAYFTNTSYVWSLHTESGYVDYRQQNSYYVQYWWGRPQYESVDSYSNLQSSGGTARGPQPRPVAGAGTYKRLYRPSYTYNYSGIGTSGTGGNQLSNFTDALTIEGGKYQDKDDRAVYTSTTNNNVHPLFLGQDGRIATNSLRNSSLGPQEGTTSYSWYYISFSTTMYSGYMGFAQSPDQNYHNTWKAMANGNNPSYILHHFQEGPIDWERNSSSHSYTTFTYYTWISTKWGSYNQARTGYSYKYGFRYKSSNSVTVNSSPGGYVGNLNTVSSETVSNAPYIASGQSSAPASGSAQGAHSLDSYTNPTRLGSSSIDPFGGETKSWILEYDFLCAGNPTYGDNPTLVKRGFKSIEYPMSYCAAPGDSTTKFEGTISSTIRTEDIYFGVRHVMSGFGGRMGPMGYFLEGIDNSNVTLTATAGTASASAGCKVDEFGDTIMIMGYRGGYPNNGGVIYQSTDDGDTWTFAAITPTQQTLSSIAYKPPSGRDEGIYVAGALNYNGEILVSTDDGKTWTSIDPYPGVSTIRSVKYLNNRFIAVGENGQDFISSPDGLVWGQQEYTGTVYNNPYEMWDVAYGTLSGSGLYVAVGRTGCIMTSSDAITWTQLSNAFGGSYSTNRGVAYGNGTFVVVNSHGTLLTSTNGTQWFGRTNVYSQATYPMSGTNYGMYGVAYGATGGNGTWVVVGDWGVIQTSTDNGVTWTHRSSGYDTWNSGEPSGQNSHALWDVTYTSNGTFVVVGAGSNSAGGQGTIIISTDNGVTWTSKASPMSASGSNFYGAGNSNQGQSTNEAYGPSYIIGSRKDSATKKGFDDVRFKKIVNSDFWSNDTAIKPEKYPGEVNNFPGNFHVSGNDYGWNPNLNSGDGDYVIKWSGSTEVVIPQYDNRIFSLAEDDSSNMIKAQTRYSLQYRPLRNLTRKYYDHSSAFTNAEMSTNVSNLPNNTFVAHGRDGRFGAHRAVANEYNSNTSTFDLQKYIERFFCLSSGSIVVDNRGGGTNYSFFNPYGNKANILQWMINDGKGHYPFGSSHADKATEILGWRVAYPQDFDRYVAYLKHLLKIFKFDMNSTVITGSDNTGDYSTYYEADYYGYTSSTTNYRYDNAANVAAANTFERWLEYMFPTQTAAADSSTSLVSHGSAGIACVLAVNTQTTQAVTYYSENYASSHMNVGNTFVRNNGSATTYGKDACVPVMYIFKRSHVASSTSSDHFDYYREITNVCGNPSQYGLSTFGSNQYAGIWYPQNARENFGLLNIVNDGVYGGSNIRDGINTDYNSKFFPSSNQCKYQIAIVPSPYVTAKVLFSSAHFFGQSGQRNIISNANDSEANVTVQPNTRKNPRAPHVPGNSEHYTESINLGYRYRYDDTADTGNSNTLKESSYTGYFKQQSNSITNNDIIYDNSELRGQEGYAFRLYSGQNQTVSYVDDFYGKHGHQANNIMGGNAHFNSNIDFICSAGSLVCVQDYDATNIYAQTNGGFMGPDYSEVTNYNNTNLLFNKYGTRYKILRDHTTLKFEMHRMNWSYDWATLELYFYDTPFGYGGINSSTGEALVQGRGIPNYSGTPGDIANTATGAPVGYWKGFLFRLFVRLYSNPSGWPGYNRVIVDTGGYADSTGGTVITNLSNYGTGSGANQYGAYYHNVTFSTGNLVSTQYSTQGVANFTSDFINNSITLPPVMWVEPASGWKYNGNANASYATQHGGCAARGTYSGSGRAEVAMKLIHS